MGRIFLFTYTALSILLTITSYRILQYDSQVIPSRNLTGADAGRNQIKADFKKGTYFLYKPGSFKTDMDSATFYFKDAERISRVINDQDLIARSTFYEGETFFELDDYPRALKQLDKVIEFYQNKERYEDEAAVWQVIGERYFWKAPRNFKILQQSSYYFDKAYQIYKRLGLDEKAALNLKNKADAHLNQGRLEIAEKELLLVLAIYKRTGFKNLHFTYDLLADVYRLKGDLAKSLYYSYECVKSMEETNDMYYASIFYEQLGLAYRDLGNNDLCIEWLKKAAYDLDLKKNISYPYLFNVVNTLCKELVRLGKNEEALAILKKLVNDRPPENTMDKALVAGAFAYSYDSNNQSDLAEVSYINRIQFYEKSTDYLYPIDLAGAYFDLGKFYEKHANYNMARINIQKTLEFPEGIVELSQIKEANLYLFKIDSAQGNYFSAIKYFQRYKDLNDSLFNEKKSKQIEELQITYDIEKKEKELITLKTDVDVEKARTFQAKNTTNFVLGILGLLLISTFLLWRAYQLKQKNNRLLVSQRSEIDQKNNVLQKLLNDKEFLIKEIHHRVKNNLQIVMSLLNSQSTTLQSVDAIEAIQKSQHRLYAISLIHQKLYTTNDVKQVEMSNYIKDLVSNFRDTFDIQNRINFELCIDTIYLDETQAVSVGLILNEAITNAIKYGFPEARKGTISIFMILDEINKVVLKIKDDGIGIPVNVLVGISSSLGMNLIKGLAKQLDGKACISSQGGTIITVDFFKNAEPYQHTIWSLSKVN